MEVRKTLLKAARLLALTGAGAAGAQATAEAATTQERVETVRPVAATPTTDPLFELMQRSNGSLSAPALIAALRDMFSTMSPGQIGVLPGLLRSLHGMGASADTLADVRDLLFEIVSSASNVEEPSRQRALEQLETEIPGFRLAQSRKQEEEQRRRRREREEVGQTPGAPGAAS